MMKKYFSNETLQQQFNAKGYVIIDLLDKNVIQELLHFYQETHQNGGEGFHCTLYNPDFSKKKHIDQKLKTMLSPIIKQHLSNFKPLIANFAVKEPQASGINLHQDWCFVDESKHFSLNIWLPLVDVDEKNGCYHVISGSHKIYRTFRGTNIPLSCQEIMPQIDFQQMTRLEMKAGQAIIYDHRLMHTTPTNMTKCSRIAITFNLIPTEAEAVHYAQNQIEDTIDCYGIDETFFYEYVFASNHINQIPDSFTVKENNITNSKVYFSLADIKHLLKPMQESSHLKKWKQNFFQIFSFAK